MLRLICPYCGKKQFQSAHSKKIASYIHVIPLFIVFLVNLFFSLTIGIGITFLILLVTLFILTMPFYLELSDQEEFWF